MHLGAGLALNLFGRRAQRGFGARAQRQLGAFAGEPQSDRFAEPLAGSGHDRDTILKTEIHRFLPGANRRRPFSASRVGWG